MEKDCNILYQRTFKLHRSLRGGLNHRHPSKSQQPQPNNSRGTRNHGQTKQNRRYDDIVQIKEAEVMPKPLGHK